MPRIKIKQVQSGQILQAKAVCPNGRVLLAKNTTLNDKHIEILNSWGVVEVNIQGDSSDKDEISVNFSELTSIDRDKINKDINDRFRLCDKEHPLIKELIAEIRNRLVQANTAIEKNV